MGVSILNGNQGSGAVEKMNKKNGKTIYYNDGRIVLVEDNDLYLIVQGLVYQIGSHGYEPCTYLIREGMINTTIHNAFTSETILSLARDNKTCKAITGTVYDLGRMCRMLAFASSFADCSIDYVEGKMAIERLKELGATSSETAVELAMTGIDYIPSAMSHSKRLNERMMKTPDGKVYVRIIFGRTNR